MYTRHIVLDTEFTPISKVHKEERSTSRFEIIQIGAVMLDAEYKEIDTFHTYVKPQYAAHIARNVSKLTGITDADVSDAPSFAEALDELFAWIGDERVRIYSWSLADRWQMQDESLLKGVYFPAFRWMDLQKVYGRMLGYHGQLSLKNAALAASFDGFSDKEAHSALYDARLAAQLLVLSRDRATFERKTKTVRELLCPTCGACLGDLFTGMFQEYLAANYA